MMTGFGMGFGGFGLILMVLFWGALIAGVVWLVTALVRSRNQGLLQVQTGMNALEILDQRFAKGELNNEQYETMKK